MEKKDFLYEEESYVIKGGAFAVYKEFRNRHKEIVYQRALVQYLKDSKLGIEIEKQIPIYFKSKKVGVYIPDIVVNERIFIELKRKPFLTKDDQQQFWYYLKATEYQVGYLINFGGSNGVQIYRRVYDKVRSN